MRNRKKLSTKTSIKNIFLRYELPLPHWPSKPRSPLSLISMQKSHEAFRIQNSKNFNQTGGMIYGINQWRSCWFKTQTGGTNLLFQNTSSLASVMRNLVQVKESTHWKLWFSWKFGPKDIQWPKHNCKLTSDSRQPDSELEAWKRSIYNISNKYCHVQTTKCRKKVSLPTVQEVNLRQTHWWYQVNVFCRQQNLP